ncbi:MAG: L-threonylcarbamoyladenylate synthase [Candidatus Micrarchaeia archaeon]
MTKILKVNAFRPEKDRVALAAQIIRNGGTVIFPTETVYGLGANAFDSEAALKVFKAKGRPADNPLIVHIASMQQLNEVVSGVPAALLPILNKVWPGPITFIFNKHERIPLAVTGGLRTVAVRMPAHPVALELIKEAGVPIAAPSANAATRPSPTKVEHIIKEMSGKVDAIIDAGQTFFGLESTIVDVTKSPPILLRPGPFTLELLHKILGNVIVAEAAKGKAESAVAIAPGMKYKHYAPQKRLLLVADTRTLEQIAQYCHDHGIKMAVLCSSETANALGNNETISLGSEKNMYEIASNLFDSFRRLDELEAKFGLVQSFSEKGIGLAIMNRIRKAAGFSYIKSLAEFKDLLAELETDLP